MRHILHAVFDERVIQRELMRLGREIKATRRSHRDKLLVVALLEGGAIFAADLVRILWKHDVPLDFVHTKISLYNEDMSERSVIVYSWQQMPAVEGRDVLLVDDTVGTGRTFSHVRKHLLTCGARSVDLAVVYNATGKDREPDTDPRYALFRGRDDAFFRAGYGEDADGELRHLPFIAAMSDDR